MFRNFQAGTSSALPLPLAATRRVAPPAQSLAPSAGTNAHHSLRCPWVPDRAATAGPGRTVVRHVTNNNLELFPKGEEDPSDAEYVMSIPWVDPNTPNPELGDLRSRVPYDWFDLAQDDLEWKEDAEYWFNPPPGGWKTHEPKKLKVMKPLPAQIMSCAEHLGEGRAKLSELSEGQVLTGEVIEMSLFHGLHVDLGAEFDGLIPVRDQYMWDELKTKYQVLKPQAAGELDVGKTCTVRIHKIRDPDIYRWPVQLVLESPSVPCLLPENWDPDSWRCPKDLRNIHKQEDLERYFTREELMGATAKYLPDIKYDIWEDPGFRAETWYYQEEQIDEEGLPYEKWLPIPAGKDGKQKTGYFVRMGINVAPHSVIYPDDDDDDHPMEDNATSEADKWIRKQASLRLFSSDTSSSWI